MKLLIVLTAVMLCLTACSGQPQTTALDQNKTNWDELAAAPEATTEVATVKNGFLLLLR